MQTNDSQPTASSGWGPFRELVPLAEGAFATVYAGKHIADGRAVVLKVLRDADAAEALRREFELGTRCLNPHLGEALDLTETPGGRPVLVLAAHPGEPLTDQRGPWDEARVAGLGLQLARALDALHAEGVVHRDVSPANVLLTSAGHARLIDLGLAAPVGITPVGAAGTPLYMAPEAITGGAVDPRSDMYALGALLYRQACGEAPFEALDAEAMVAAVLRSPPPPLGDRAPHLSGALTALVMRLLAKDPADRPATARDVIALLAPLAATAGEPAPGRWRDTPAFQGWLACGARVAAFVGEPGLGASRHLHAAFVELRREGRAALRLAAEPGDAPFTLVERLWRWAEAVAGPDASGLVADERALVDGLWDWTSPAPDASVGADRLVPALVSGLKAMLGAIGGRFGAWVLVDAWEDADAESRAVLGRVAAEGGARLITAGRKAPEGAETFALAPFAREDALAWLQDAAQAPLAAAAAERLYRASGGNPGWMHLALARGLHQQPDAAVPDTVEALLERQWAGLGASGRALVTAIGVFGRPFAPDDMKDVGSWLPSDWPLALAGLVASGVLVAEGDTHRFRHGWWAGFVASRTEPAVRARLALGLARALESRWRPVTDAGRLHRLAELYAESGDVEAIVRMSLDAGRALAKLHANRAAEAHFAAGLAAIARAPKPERWALERRALMIARADVQRLTGALAEAAAAYEACLSAVVLPGERARLLVSLGKTRQMLNRYQPAKEALEEALSLLSASAEPMERLRALTALGRVLHFLGEREGSLARYEEALAIARAARADAFVAESLAFIGTMRAARADTAATGLAALEEALALREAAGDMLGRSDTHMLLGNALFALGRWGEAARHFEANRALASRVASPQEEAFAHLNLALCELELGDWPRAAASLSSSRALAAAASDAFLLGLGAAFESLARLHLGELAAMDACLAEAREREAAMANPTLRLYGLLVEAERHLFLGGFEHARRAAELAVGLIEKGHEPEAAARAQVLLAEAWTHQGSLVAAGKALAAADAALSQSGNEGARASYGRVAGWLAYREGRRDEARARWREALAIALASGMAHQEVQLRLALHLLDRQDPTAPIDDAALEAACQTAERLRAPEPLALGCLALGVRRLDDGQEVFAERLFGRGHELLGHYTQALGGPGARASFLAHPARAPFCEVQALEEAHLLQRRGRRLEMLLALGRAIGATRDPGVVLEQVRTFTLDITLAERCVILLADGPHFRIVGPEAPYSRTIVKRVAESRESVCVLDTATDEGLRTQASILDLQVRSVMCVPLLVAGALHGVLYVDSRVALGAFTAEDLVGLEAIAKQAAVAIDNARLHQALAEQLRRQGDYIQRLEASEHVIRHLEELDRVRGEYFQGASHDLRAPLASIHVSCQALLKGILGPVTADQAEAVEGIHHGAKSLMGLIDGILDAAKLEAGKLTLHPRPVSIARPVVEAATLVRALASAKGLTLGVDTAALQALPPVSGDERRLQQVFLNLIANAIKFTAAGGVTVGGEATASGVVVWVSDTGPGIPAGRLSALFERYGESTEGTIAGSGLGLWLVKSLVDLHGGAIALDTAPDRGTTFRLTFPPAPQPAVRQQPPS